MSHNSGLVLKIAQKNEKNLNNSTLNSKNLAKILPIIDKTALITREMSKTQANGFPKTSHQRNTQSLDQLEKLASAKREDLRTAISILLTKPKLFDKSYRSPVLRQNGQNSRLLKNKESPSATTEMKIEEYISGN